MRYLYILGLVLAYWTISPMVVFGHDWYSSTSDPLYFSSCCGGHDCAPIDPTWVSPAKDGFHLKLTLEQAQSINPATVLPVDAFIPWSRVQTPPTNTEKAEYFACIYDRDRTAPRNGVICFFASPGS